MGDERAGPELGEPPRLFLPSLFVNRPLPFEDSEGAVIAGPDLSIMAEQALVSNPPPAGVGDAASFPSTEGSAGIQSGGSTSPVPQRILPTDRLEIIRNSLGERGFSESVIKLLLAGRRSNTNAAYESAWRAWSDWCRGGNRDPMHNCLKNVLSFLADAFESGKAYSSINVLRSMLSVTLNPVEGYEIGKHPHVVALMKGIYNSNPPRPRYNNTWDVDVVLGYLSGLRNEDLDLGTLSRKLATLLALGTLARTADLASIDWSTVKFTEGAVNFSLSRPRKAQKSGPLQSFSLKSLPDRSIDPVSCLGCYISLTDSLRSQNSRHALFIGLRKPHNPVSASTIGRWIKDQLGDAGVDTSMFTAHSVRGAGSSKAAASPGVPIASILSAAHWSSESTFSKFYRREIVSAPSVAEVILTTCQFFSLVYALKSP